jgi:hypothetical protein
VSAIGMIRPLTLPAMEANKGASDDEHPVPPNSELNLSQCGICQSGMSLWVKSDRTTMLAPCPLCPRERPNHVLYPLAGLGQFRPDSHLAGLATSGPTTKRQLSHWAESR